ncbi:MAG: CusA/CzcA family heavy metal efflux RND transporter [Nitrospirota bacterium]|nr:CusA/CzcA family heavy metal efflux RND transporter [Nitrospirota bacterium]
MLKIIIDWCLKNRFLVLIATTLLVAAGLLAVRSTPLDAIPDLSDVQVIVFTEYPGQGPQVVEDQITYPLTTTLLSVPGADVVRGYSFFGLSFVYIIFADGTDMYWARSRVLELLNFARGRLPAGVNPSLGPDATGVGWIYEYALVDRSGGHDLAQLRSIQDWFLRYPLQTVPGVAEVASVGGYVKQYQVEVNPNALLAYNIPLSRVRQAIMQSNNDVGGGTIEMGETEYMVRGLGYIHSVDDLKPIPVGVDARGTPVRLQDVAQISIGPEMRRGITELGGKGEVVGGVVVMRYGENALTTIRLVRAKLAELSRSLPEGVEIVPVYDRGDLIERAVHTLSGKLLEEFLVISLVCVLFLFHARSALVAILTLPLGMLAAFLVMRAQGINANIMSLGGIAITLGAMVDGAIVLIENAHRHLAAATGPDGRPADARTRWAAITRASHEVGPALFYSLLIITVSFLPVFTLEAQEGRLFKPLAFTKTYAMAAAAVLSITVVPLLMGFFIRGRIPSEGANPLNRWLRAAHRPLLGMALRHRTATLVGAGLLVAATAWPVLHVGSEFMPPLDEGDLLYMPTTFPGISVTKAKELLQQTDRVIATFPEVDTVFGKVGRAESATDPAMLSMLETTIRLKPRDQWPDPHKDTADLIRELDRSIRFPGVANAWTMPIKTRIDMLSTGIKTPVGVKISGPSLIELERLAGEVERALKNVPGTVSAFGDRAVGGNFFDFVIRRAEAARYGLTVADVQDVISTAVGGMTITNTVEGLERYPVNLRYPRDLRDDPERLARVLIPTPSGAQIPLSQVADVRMARGPASIKSEGARPNAWVYVDIDTSDIGGYVARAREAVNASVTLPPGYALVWSGQFEYMQRAAERLKLVVPLTLLLIFLLLYFHFRNPVEPLVVMLCVPFAMVGGMWLVYLLGYNLSVAVAVGFIALSGVASEIGVLVLTFIDHEVQRLREEKRAEARSAGGDERLSAQQILDAAHAGTAHRLRPIAMTAVAVTAGLVPIMWGGGSGADVMRRIAAPMIGGMVTTTLLCLVVLPVVYARVLTWREGRGAAPGQGPGQESG